MQHQSVWFKYNQKKKKKRTWQVASIQFDAVWLLSETLAVLETQDKTSWTSSFIYTHHNAKDF